MDLISRQAAIEALKDWYDGMIISSFRGVEKVIKALPSAQPEMNMDEWCTDCKEYDHEKHCCPRWNRVIRQTLKDAQPEPHWIPCSEKLPEDGTDCLVSVRCSKKVVVVDMATYSTDLFNVDKEDFFGNRGESGWYYFSGEYGYCKVLNVIAWMPLPTAYREDGGS